MRGFLAYTLKVHGEKSTDQLRLLAGTFMGTVGLGTRPLYSCIPGSKPLTLVTWDGFTFLVRPNTADLHAATMIYENYELTRWFYPNAKGVVVDVGANVGGYAVRACRSADLVIAIEPQRQVFDILATNVRINGRSKKVVLIRKAISDGRRMNKLRIPRSASYMDTDRATLIEQNCEQQDHEVEEVETDTLDNVITSIGVSRISLLKIDVEGAEGVAFDGMLHTLSITNKLMIEISKQNRFLLSKLEKLGFRLIDKTYPRLNSVSCNYFYERALNGNNQRASD